MSDTPETATEALKRALAAKKKAATAHGGQPGSARAEEKAQQARSVALAKPAFRKASKRG
ncbi:hypothetical protein [Brevundimonas sp.]|jgi:hypothetical protein|uniref:hypothetical protein n=1 Tax=Brevundimonas sp. TaxID=1871086 RepID=UPI00263378F5|nr:hypothetical protein [Brevundimonas sp.]